MEDDFDYLDDPYLDNDHAVGSSGGAAGDGSWFGPWEAGTAFALAGWLADRHADKVIAGQGQGHGQDVHVDVHLHPEPEPPPRLINAAEGKRSPKWEMFFGQEPLKKQMRVAIDSAKARGAALDHTLLASGNPGFGKTTLARIIADEMDAEFIMLVPPFHKDTLNEAAMGLSDRGILFLDEIHRLVEYGKGPAENLLHMLEERRLYLDDGVVHLNDITVIGATTDADKLPETVIDRFVNKPFFQPYSIIELCEVTGRFQGLLDVTIPIEVTLAIARACRGTPRVARELVMAARDLSFTLGRAPTPEELLDFKETDPDGMTRQHKAYITTLYEYFERVTADGEVVYVAGEYAMRSILRETRDGLYRLERFLMERGYLDRTPSGRRLSPAGIQAARRYVAERPRRAA